MDALDRYRDLLVVPSYRVFTSDDQRVAIPGGTAARLLGIAAGVESTR